MPGRQYGRCISPARRREHDLRRALGRRGLLQDHASIFGRRATAGRHHPTAPRDRLPRANHQLRGDHGQRNHRSPLHLLHCREMASGPPIRKPWQPCRYRRALCGRPIVNARPADGEDRRDAPSWHPCPCRPADRPPPGPPGCGPGRIPAAARGGGPKRFGRAASGNLGGVRFCPAFVSSLPATTTHWRSQCSGRKFPAGPLVAGPGTGRRESNPSTSLAFRLRDCAGRRIRRRRRRGCR
jgi:hypothetical protein